MTNYQAKDPSGKTHTKNTKRKVAYAIFVMTRAGTYQAQFTKTIAAAKSTWGNKGTGLTRAIEATA